LPAQVLPLAQAVSHVPPQSTPPSPPFRVPSVQLGEAMSHSPPSQASAAGASTVTHPGSSDGALHSESGSGSGSLALDIEGGLLTGGSTAAPPSGAATCATNGAGSKPSSVRVHATDSCKSPADNAPKARRRRMS
jgi:hypothetical protein